MIGLGRMGGNIVRRLMKNGHSCVVYDKSADAVHEFAGEGAKPSRDLADFVKQLEAPRAVWVMLPAGPITDATIVELSGLLRQGRHRHRRRQLVLSGRHPPRRHAEAQGHPLCRCRHQRRRVGLRARLLHDDRRRQGGGRPSRPALEDPRARARARSTATPGRERRDPRAEEGYLHCGPVGAGHFVKMVHNGIEYGVMQAYAEGFDILRNVNIPAVAGKPALQARPSRHCRGMAARQRDRVLAA